VSLVKSVAVIGGLTLISRILGFVRDILIAARLGAGIYADVFFVAFKLPNFFRSLFAEGAFSSAFVPIFSGMLATEGKAAARVFADKVFTILLLVLLVFTLIMQFAMPVIMLVLAPGFAEDKEKFALAVHLTRITMPYLLCMSLVALCGGMLNSVGKFWAMAASPILLNLTMVAAILYLTHYTQTPAHALSWGVAIAGVVQLVAIMVACQRAGLLVRFRLPGKDSAVGRMLKNMVPGIVGSGIVQINLWVDTIIATLLPHGAVSLLYYADRVNQLPLAIIGTAMGTALLPLLSQQMRASDLEGAQKTQNRALEFGLLLTLPCTVMLIMTASPLIAVLFERGAFTAVETRGSAAALMAFSSGLPAFVMVKIFAPCFFAVHDTKTPVKYAVTCMILNIVLNLILMQFLQHVGIALATALSAWVNVLLLSVTLYKRKLFAVDAQLKKRLPRIVLSCLVMGMMLWAGNQVTEGMGRMGVFLILAVTGGMTFIMVGYVVQAFDLKEIKSVFRRKGSLPSEKK
jgi:putative peptidoglycan lipid II flippase